MHLTFLVHFTRRKVIEKQNYMAKCSYKFPISLVSTYLKNSLIQTKFQHLVYGKLKSLGHIFLKTFPIKYAKKSAPKIKVIAYETLCIKKTKKNMVYK